LVRDIIRRYARDGDLTVISGGARGIDSMAAAEARAQRVPVVEHRPLTHRVMTTTEHERTVWYLAGPDGTSIGAGLFTTREADGDYGRRHAWRSRNQAIAHDCDRLIRIADPASGTYGSGWTRDRARELGKPTYGFVIGHARPQGSR
jgi:hypothetical protein